jgi:diguanylate cyclase (GGDEF)-like protein
MKNVNDRHGYDVGDEILRKLGAYLKRHVRAEDVACRSGGDEFTLILLGMPDNVAMSRADRLRQGVHELQVKTYDLLPVGTTASFGLASFPHHGSTAAEILRAADIALHKAKSGDGILSAGLSDFLVSKVPSQISFVRRLAIRPDESFCYSRNWYNVYA